MTGDQRELALERICLNLIELITDLGRLDELSLVGPRLPAFQDPHAKMRVMMAWQSAWLVAGRVETAVNLLRGLRTHLSSHFPIMVHPESWRDYGKELARSGGAGGGAQLIMEAGQIATALEDIDEDDFAAQVVVTILENAAALQPDDPLSGRARLEWLSLMGYQHLHDEAMAGIICNVAQSMDRVNQVPQLLQMITLSESMPVSVSRCKALLEISSAWLRLGQPVAAEVVLSDLEDFVAQLPERGERLDVLRGVVALLNEIGSSRAGPLLQEAIRDLIAENDPGKVSRWALDLVVLCFQINDVEMALGILTIATGVVSQITVSNDRARVLEDLVDIVHRLPSAEGLAFLQQMNPAALGVGFSPLQFHHLLVRVGLAYVELDQSRSLGQAQQCRALLAQIKDPLQRLSAHMASAQLELRLQELGLLAEIDPTAWRTLYEPATVKVETSERPIVEDEILAGGSIHGFSHDWLLPALEAFETMEPGVSALILTFREPGWWNERVNLPINVVQFSRDGRGADMVLLELPAIVYSIQGYFEGRGRCIALVDVTDELLEHYAPSDVMTWFKYLQSSIADGPGAVLMGLDIPRWKSGPQQGVLDLMDLVDPQ